MLSKLLDKVLPKPEKGKPFLSVTRQYETWMIVVPSLCDLILYEHADKHVIQEKLDHYERLFQAYERWKKVNSK